MQYERIDNDPQEDLLIKRNLGALSEIQNIKSHDDFINYLEGLISQRSIDQLLPLLQNIYKLLSQEVNNSDILPSTIEKANERCNSYTRADNLVFIPKQPGQLIVIGDLHGDLETFLNCLKTDSFIERATNGENVQLVLAGDLLDRGPAQIELMLAVMILKISFPLKVSIIKADHDSFGHHWFLGHDSIGKFLQFYYDDVCKKLLEESNENFRDRMNELLSTRNSISTEDSEDAFTFRQKLFALILELFPFYKENTKMPFSNEALSKLAKAAAIRLKGFIPESTFLENNLLEDFIKRLYRKFYEYIEITNQSFFNLLPRMVVTGNEIIIVHGGPPFPDFDLNKLTTPMVGYNRKKLQHLFDSMISWGDPIDKNTHLYNTHLFYTKKLFKALEDILISKGLAILEPDGITLSFIETKNEFLVNYTKVVEKDMYRNLHYDMLKSHPAIEQSNDYKGIVSIQELKDCYSLIKTMLDFGIVFNFERTGLRNDYLSLERIIEECRVMAVYYCKDTVDQFLQTVGGKLLVRAHQPSANLHQGVLQWGNIISIHSTGAGSSQSAYANVEMNPLVAIFNLDQVPENGIKSYLKKPFEPGLI